jgi:hypothetical protein
MKRQCPSKNLCHERSTASPPRERPHLLVDDLKAAMPPPGGNEGAICWKYCCVKDNISLEVVAVCNHLLANMLCAPV